MAFDIDGFVSEIALSKILEIAKEKRLLGGHMAQDAKIPGDMFKESAFKSIANKGKRYSICHDCGGKYRKWGYANRDNVLVEIRQCSKCGKTQYRKAELIS